MLHFVGSVMEYKGDGSTKVVACQIDPNDEWVYVQRTQVGIKMWSAGSCSECSVDLLSVRRCQIHRELIMVAVQCRLL